MDWFLIAARAVHFAATISLAGVFIFDCLIAAPVFTPAATAAALAPRLDRQLDRLAWASLGLALASGAAWLVAVASSMSGQPLGAALTSGAWEIVATRTQFGQAWLARLAFAVAIAICLAIRRRRRVARWAALLFAAPLLAGIAWAGHGAATVGAAGDLHLAGDILHLLGAGGWLGTLLPFALLLVAVRRDAGPQAAATARHAARRYSVLAFVSVALLLAGGLVNTWFLAGTVPALVGTVYGRLLLAKIALFLGTLVIAAFNLLRLSPRLAVAGSGAVARTLAWMRRNALLEMSLGIAVLAVVAVLGILPPGLHTEPGWPFPYRIDAATLSLSAIVTSAVLLAALGAVAVAVVVCAAAARYRTMAACAAAFVLCIAALWLPLRRAIEPAYPTSFYAPAQPYAAPSIAQGATVYAANCAPCHGAQGKGDGPAAAGLPVRPANLTEPHLFAHTPGDLFWWVSNGKANGAMPGFAAVLAPDQRWDVINFVRARAAGVLSQNVGPQISATAGQAVPDFAFETNGAQSTLRRALTGGSILLVLFAPPAPAARLAALAAAQEQLTAAGLRVLAVETGSSVKETGEAAGAPSPLVVTVSPAVKAVLNLFRGPDGGAETELLLDRNADIRARWTAATEQSLPDAATLVADAHRAAEVAVAAPNHAGHGG